MAERRLRPLGLGDIFDEGFDLYKRNWTFLVLVTAAVAVPLDIVMTILCSGELRGLYNAIGQNVDADTSAFFSSFSQLSVLIVAYSLAYSVPLTALAFAASQRYLGVSVTLQQAYRVAFRRLPSLLLTSLLFSLIGGVAYYFCVVPGLFWTTFCVFTIQAFAVEGKSFFKAFGRSSNLVSGYGWRSFGVQHLLGHVYWIIVLGIWVPLSYGFDKLFQLLPVAHGLYAGGSALHNADLRGQIVVLVSFGIANLIVIPLLVSILTVLYYDLRVRKEAFDIELLAQDLGYAPLSITTAGVIPAAMPPLAPPRRAGGRAR